MDELRQTLGGLAIVLFAIAIAFFTVLGVIYCCAKMGWLGIIGIFIGSLGVCALVFALGILVGEKE